MLKNILKFIIKTIVTPIFIPMNTMYLGVCYISLFYVWLWDKNTQFSKEEITETKQRFIAWFTVL